MSIFSILCICLNIPALFSLIFFWKNDIVALSFLFDKHCPIMK